MQIDELKKEISTIRQEKITGENIYQLLLAFDKLYQSFTEAERKELIQAFIESLEIYDQKPDNSIWIRKIRFAFPIPMNGKNVIEYSLENQETLETIVLLQKLNS